MVIVKYWIWQVLLRNTLEAQLGRRSTKSGPVIIPKN